MNGRSTFTVTLRLRDEIHGELESRAKKKGMTLGIYLTDCINRSADSSVHTIESTSTEASGHSVHTTETESTGTENHSVHTTKDETVGTPNRSVHTKDFTKDFTKASELISNPQVSPDRLKEARESLKLGEEKAGIKQPYNPETMNRTMDLPIYNAAIHKAGDKVRFQVGKRWFAKIVPEIDGDGNVIGRV